MRVGEIVRKLVFLAALLAVATVCEAQTADPATNVTAVVRGGVVIVSYDLVSANPTAEFSVTLEASSNGGKTYDVRPKTVKGDIGPVVRAGTNKQISWEASQDVENLAVDRYRYRVVAKPLSVSAAASKTSALAQAPKAPTPLPAQPAPVVQASGGNGRKWGGIVLLGAGGTLAALGAVMKKETEVCDVHNSCFTEKKTNMGLVFTGLGAAGGGVALLAMSGRKDSVHTEIVMDPRGIRLQHRLTFNGMWKGLLLRR